MRDWLDHETRAILAKQPPRVPAAVDGSGYSLLMLECGPDEARVAEAIAAVQHDAGQPANKLPFVIAQRLSMEDALAGQFALACCDCAALFVPDDAVDRANPEWLRELYLQAMRSPDFQRVAVNLPSVPNTQAGRRFCWQFLGLATGVALPATLHVLRLKAELMLHWGHKIGAVFNASRVPLS